MKSSAKSKSTFAETSKAAHIGIPEAQYELGLMYAHAMGVEQDIAQAVFWVRKAAERGLASAQYLLGTRYANGAGIEQDERLALWWFFNAAQQGHAKALLKLGKGFALARPSLAHACMHQAAHMGLAEAQFAIAQELTSSLERTPDYVQAFDWYRQSAEQGFAPAQCALAGLYLNGQGVERDVEEAIFWYQQAADSDVPGAVLELAKLQDGSSKHTGKSFSTRRQHDARRWDFVFESGDADARYHLGVMYERAIGVPHDAHKARTLYTLAAQQKDVRAQLALAKMLEDHSDAEHLTWYQEAAKNGCAQAQYALGKKYTQEQGLGADTLLGLFWYCNAIVQDDALALKAVGDLCHEHLEKVALACFQKLAHQEDAYGQFMLGHYLAHGKGIAKDLRMAFYWWQKSAAQGYTSAQTALGAAYLTGQGVEKNTSLAFSWFEKAALQNDAKAQWNLGSLYASDSPDIARDLRQAFDWCQKSANQDFVPAQATLGVLYMLIQNVEQAIFWWRKAAEHGDAEAQYNLAMTLSKNSDAVQAFHWFFQAAAQGLIEAQSQLGFLYATGTGVATDAIEAHKWFLLAAHGKNAAALENLRHSQALLNSMQIAEATRRAQLIQPSISLLH